MTLHSFTVSILVFICFWGISHSAHSQSFKDNSISIKDLNLSTKLSSNNIRKVIQDPMGFMWVATQDGLNRFDGKDVLIFRNDQGKYGRLNELDIRDIVLDSVNKKIWVLQPNSISAIDYEKIRVVKNFSIPPITSDDWNMKLLISGDKLWISSYRGLKTFSTSTEKLQTILKLPTIQNNTDIDRQINTIYHGSNNLVWACFNTHGIYIIEEKSMKVWDHQENSLIINDILFSGPGDIIMAANSGLFFCKYQFPEKQFSIAPIVNSKLIGPDQPILSLSRLGQNKFVAISPSKIFVFTQETSSPIVDYSPYSDGEKQWLLTFSSLFNDGKNNLWITSSKGMGILRLGEQLFAPYNKKTKNLDLEHVNCILPLDEKNILTGLKHGLKKINSSDNSIQTIETSDYYYHIFKGPDNHVLISGAKQFSCYVADKLVNAEVLFPELKPFSKFTFISSVKSNDSTWVLATENGMGVLVWNYKNRTIKNINASTKPASLGANLINTVYLNSKKQLVILSNNLITLIDSNLNRSQIVEIIDTKSNSPYGVLFDIIEDENYYWLTAYGTGILQLGKNFSFIREFGLSEKLCNSGVYKLFNDDSTLWVTTNNGLSLFNKKLGTFSNYFEEDGLHSNSFEEGSGIIFQQQFFAGGENGFSIINSRNYKSRSLTEKVYAGHYKMNFAGHVVDSFSLTADKIYIDPNAQQLILHLSIPNYDAQEKINYYYRIKELQDQWNVNESQNIISLFRLSPGKYTLELKASFNGSQFSAITTLKLYFLPKWYQTWLFKLLVFLATAGIIYAFYRYRITQIKKQHEIRKNIATDLHDDLGSTLNSVKVFTNLAISGVKQEESLQQVKDNLNEATMGLRDMIWVLDDSLDTVDELVTRLKQYAIPVTGASNMEATIKAESEVNSRQLTKEEKRNLFLVCKEAINNSIKYSEATRINVDIIASGKKIQITVADNGKGFNTNEVKKGYGLKNMQYRAGQIKYQVTLISSPDKGTRITLQPQ